MALNRTAQLAKDAAEARREKEFRDNVRSVVAWVLFGLVVASCAIAWKVSSQKDSADVWLEAVQEYREAHPIPSNTGELAEPLTLPPADTFVIAFRPSGQWYKAYVDPNGDFHNADDGTPLGTVTHWKYAN